MIPNPKRMGLSERVQVPAWVLLGIVLLQKNVQATHCYNSMHTNDPNLRMDLPSHPGGKSINKGVCSTWGNFHFKNFNGNVFQFPGTCSYLFASDCNNYNEDFHIQIKRSADNSAISDIAMRIRGVYIRIQSALVSVNDLPVPLPFIQYGIQVKKEDESIKVSAQVGISFLFNGNDRIELTLNEEYSNQTCGLCGNLNGISTDDTTNDILFWNKHKVLGPGETCDDPSPSQDTCTDVDFACQSILKGPAFVECNALLDVSGYIAACVQDLCNCNESLHSACLCSSITEYSWACAGIHGNPKNWRGPDLCPVVCPFNMEYQECGYDCEDSCSNQERSELCGDVCSGGCFCPPGTILDDIDFSGCIHRKQCSCIFRGHKYPPGGSFFTTCRSCNCNAGQWSCMEHECAGTCSVEGGSRITTYDNTAYTFHGNCIYILSKLCRNSSFIVEADIVTSKAPSSQTVLRSVILQLSSETIIVYSSGIISINQMNVQLPILTGDVIIFEPTSHFIIVHVASLGLQLKIQILPIMQLYISLEPYHKGKTCGLCGNFNNILTDEFLAVNGLREGTAISAANSWKSLSHCPSIRNEFVDPCSFNSRVEQYAEHWCALLKDRKGPFSGCHGVISPNVHYVNCRYDVCACEKTEDCLCAALESYAAACTAKGVFLDKWLPKICNKCPEGMEYSYSVSTCQPSCRSLNAPDASCSVQFLPVDGCVCKAGTYVNEDGNCVPPYVCPCYYKDNIIPPGKETVFGNGVSCTCTQGKLACISVTTGCTAPMVYFNCSNAPLGARGSECQKNCQNLNMPCISIKCVSGCICPRGMVLKGRGHCINQEKCPCLRNGVSYQQGENTSVGCKNCTCNKGMWECTKKETMGTCSLYGKGHYITFDRKRFTFDGNCEYTLAEDYCDSDSSGTFQVVTESVAFDASGATCSKSVKVLLESCVLILRDGSFKHVGCNYPIKVDYTVRQSGIFLVIEVRNVLILIWDKKTRITLKVEEAFKGKLCGLCGNFDNNGENDFYTRSQDLVGSVSEFGNSWKMNPSCLDVKGSRKVCSDSHRLSWAKDECSIITSDVFRDCHNQVDACPYYEACVSDSCACTSGGDCECFCTAVAAYAQACNEACICVHWRTPDICPLFCDYYNSDEDDCEWNYKACGAPCLKTCRNPSGKCLHDIPGLEGCYPNCPKDRPYLEENTMKCVAQCGCYGEDGTYYNVGEEVNACNECLFCKCTLRGIKCMNNTKVCCKFEGQLYPRNTIIKKTDDGKENCSHIICGEHGRVHSNYYPCCHCLVDGNYYVPGSLIYTRTINPDCVNSAVCSATCQIDEFLKNCTVSNCTTVLCFKNGTLIVKPPDCPAVLQVECPSQVPPRQIYDDRGCCYQYKCPQCLNADGIVADPGAHWEYNCMTCTCIANASSEDGVTVKCVPINCDHIPQQSCRPGRRPVAVLNQGAKCCPKTECLCEPGVCNRSKTNCPHGFELTCDNTTEDDCCPNFVCTRKAVCLVDDIEYSVGVFINTAVEPCSECHCSPEVDPDTQLNLIKCQPIQCYTQCSDGYEYKMLPMKCCGTCVQVACILTTEFNTTHIIKLGDSWFPSSLTCGFFTCSRVKGKLILSRVNRGCKVGTSRSDDVVDEDAVECCLQCNASLCQRKTTTLSFHGSTSDSYMDLAYCELSNGTTTIARSPSHHKLPACNCCEVLVSSVKQVRVKYSAEDQMRYTYTTAETCGCRMIKE